MVNKKKMNFWSKYFLFVGVPFPIISFYMGTILQDSFMTHLSMFLLGGGIVGLISELNRSGVFPIRFAKRGKEE